MEIDDLLVEHADAARGHRLADGLRRIGSMNAIERVLVALIEIERPRPERILWPAGHHVGQPPAILAQLPNDHLLRRMPLRPGPHEADLRDARPFEALAPDPDAIADGLAVRHDVV